MSMRSTLYFGSLVAIGLGLAACDGGTGPDGAGDVSVRLSQAAVTGAVRAAVLDASAGSVSLADVESIEILITGVRALLKGEDENGGGWVDLELAPAAQNPIDLLALPGSGIEIANGTLAAGSYGNIRILYEEATINLANDVSVGPASFLVADNPHDLTIPSGAQNGIKIPTAGFEVGEGAGETVTIEFDASLSVQNITATGSGKLMMNPVLKERGGSEEQAEA